MTGLLEVVPEAKPTRKVTREKGVIGLDFNGPNADNDLTVHLNIPKEWKTVFFYQASALFNLTEDWDGFGAKPVEKDVITASLSLVLECYGVINRFYGKELVVPEIDPIPNNGVYINWNTPDARLIIQVQRNKANGNIEASFYGDKLKHKNPVEGIMTIDKFDNHTVMMQLVEFMTHLTR